MGSHREELAATSDLSQPTSAQAQLVERICPFLGLTGDPDTAAAYARSDHECGLPGGKPALRWQNHYCLVTEHVECPRFQRAKDRAEAVTATSLIAAPSSSLPRRPRGWRLAGLVLIAMIIVAGVLAAGYLKDIGPRSSGQASDAVAGTHAAFFPQRPAIVGIGGSDGGLAPSWQSSSAAGAGIGATPDTATPAVKPSLAAKIAAGLSEQVTAVAATPESTASPQPTTAPVTLAPKPKPTPPKTESPATYTVKSGDTLTFIAQQFHTTIGALAQLNEIPDPNVIVTGLILKLPPPAHLVTNATPKAAVTNPVPTPTPNQSPYFHEVVPAADD